MPISRSSDAHAAAAAWRNIELIATETAHQRTLWSISARNAGQKPRTPTPASADGAYTRSATTVEANDRNVETTTIEKTPRNLPSVNSRSLTGVVRRSSMRPDCSSSLHTSIARNAARAGRNGETLAAQTEATERLAPSAASSLNAKRAAVAARKPPAANAVEKRLRARPMVRLHVTRTGLMRRSL